VRFVPPRFAPFAFSLIISGLMSLLVTCVATAKNVGTGAGFAGAWMAAWAFAWPIACAAILVLAPMVRRLVGAITLPPPR
jgi:pheromone shutdown protein TraB